MNRRGHNFAPGLASMREKQKAEIERRLDVIAWELTGGSVTTAEVLATLTGASVGSIYRDFKRLRARGVHIVSEAGFGSTIRRSRP